jgi:phospholipid-translocating ATPase
MRFRKLSVAGYAWLHDFDIQREAAKKLQDIQGAVEKQNLKGKGVVQRRSTSERFKHNFRKPTGPDTINSPSGRPGPGPPLRGNSFSTWKSTARPTKAQPELRTEELIRYLQQKPHSIFTKKAKFFLLTIALCHTALPEVQKNGEIEFQAASPDELALVQAARDLGYLVIDRSARSITLTYPVSGGESDSLTETYDVLDVIEFSSTRKRMSVIVRFPNGKICILCKGADSVLMSRLKLASIALQKASEIGRRASMRKSVEMDEALKRMSQSSPRTSFSRQSMTLPLRSPSQARASIASTPLHPIRDELDSWLKQRERDVEIASEEQDLSAYRSPRASMARQSFASAELGHSMYVFSIRKFPLQDSQNESLPLLHSILNFKRLKLNPFGPYVM